jgi:NAD(P)-dependent dehydrogenase (short-subunit alcohol dehydrogenase family)
LLAAYGASKAALPSLARTAAMELRSRRIRVNCVTPAYVATAMMEASRASLPGFEAVEERQFLGVIPPEEVGTAVAYLLSDAALHITGTSLVIDGGFTC